MGFRKVKRQINVLLMVEQFYISKSSSNVKSNQYEDTE